MLNNQTDQEDFIKISNVTKKYGDFTAVNSVSLDIAKGEIFCLLGGSGSGKSTLLRMIAGFEEITDGDILIDNSSVNGVPPNKLPVNMMFQSYALFPHMTVEANVAYGLKREGIAKAEIKERVADMLGKVKMSEFAKRKPHQLSGGQRQRVALARSLAKRPKVLLLDEPLGALDKNLREETQSELVQIQKELGITFVIVTHDQEEAMTLGDRIGVMDKGQIVQVGPPRELYEQPSNLFIANFLGALNHFEGRVVSTDENDLCDVKLKGVDMNVKVKTSPPFEDNQRIVITVRPEKMEIFSDPNGKPGMMNPFIGVVSSISYMGHLTVYKVMLEAGVEVTITESNTHLSTKAAISKGSTVRVEWPARSTNTFTR